MSSSVNQLEQEFDDTALDMNPDSVPLNADGTPTKTDSPTAATMVNWTKFAHDDANKQGKMEHAKKFLSLHNQAIEQTTIEDINIEISRFYFRSYQLQSAEMNIKTIANLTEGEAPIEDEYFIDSNIDRVSSLVQDAVISAHGMVTFTLSTFKDKLAIFKKNAKEILPKLKQKIGKSFSELKQKFVKAFNEVIDYFSRIFSELVTIMFSFVDLINKIAKTKGYKFKDVNISFDPPSIEPMTILGFSVPFPKVSLPKLSIGFEISSENSTNTNNQMNEKVYNKSTKNSTTADPTEQLVNNNETPRPNQSGASKPKAINNNINVFIKGKGVIGALIAIQIFNYALVVTQNGITLRYGLQITRSNWQVISLKFILRKQAMLIKSFM